MNFKVSAFNIELNTEQGVFLFNTYSGACVQMTGNEILNYSDLDAVLVDRLLQMGFLVPSDVNENSMVRAAWQSLRYADTELSFYIAPTLACNFDCYYCYSHDIKQKITSETMDLAIQYLISSLNNNTKSLSIIWLGGEPLLCLPQIDYMMAALKQKIPRTIDITSTIITNGYFLNKQSAQVLLNQGIKKCVVTIDGPAFIHNKRRTHKRKLDTYSRIVNNIQSVCHDMEVTIRVNVDLVNLPYLYDLFEDLSQLNIVDKVRISLVPVQDFNNDNELIKQNCIMYNSEINELLGIALACQRCDWGGPDPVMSVCSGARMKDFAIGPQGEMYKCPVEIGDDKKIVGNINSRVPSNYLYEWVNYSPIEKEECRNCQYLPLCFSACPHINFHFDTLISASVDCESRKQYYTSLISYYVSKHLS